MVSRQHGVTLVELLATTTLLATLSAMALPAMSRLLAEAGAERTLHRVNGALSYARYVAVTERTAVVLCPLDEAARCDGDWSRGFAVFRDPQRSARLPPDEGPLRVFPGSAARLLLRAFRTRRYFRFLPNGQTDWQNGRFVVCPDRTGVRARALVVNVQGRTRIERLGGPHPACG